MTDRGRLLAALFALVPVTVTVVLLVATVGRDEAADFELLPVNPGGPVGLAHLERDGDRVRGTVAVWGLGPGSRHLAELKAGACRPEGEQTATTVLALPALVADPNGVAFARVRARARENVIEPRRYLMVYSGPGPARANARVSCGDLFGAAELEPSALASVGPGAGARSAASTILQLRDGRPIGGPQRIEVRTGDRVALAVRSDLPDEVEVGGGIGLSQQVGPGTIARFSFLAPPPGRYDLRAHRGRASGRGAEGEGEAARLVALNGVGTAPPALDYRRSTLPQATRSPESPVSRVSASGPPDLPGPGTT